jgi:hypothetical protein
MNEQLEALKKQFTQADGTVDLAAFQATLRQSPEMQAYYEREIAKAKQGQRAALSSELLDLGLNVGYMLFSRNQVQDAQQKAAQLAQPGIPVAPGLSPELSQAIYNAQRGVDLAPTLNPARQGIEDAYTGALNQAQVASGGQAGAYQAMSQLANIERMKAQLGLAPIAQQVTLQNQDILNDLIAARADERQRQYMNQYYGTQLAMDQYNKNREGLSDQLTAGRTNMLDSVGRITGNLQNLSPYYQGFGGKKESFKDWMDRNMSMYDEDTANYMGRVVNENAANWSAPQGISADPRESYGGSFAPDEFNLTRNRRFGNV